MLGNDPLYMKRCLQLARLGSGSVSPNPRVGAVIVYKDRIIGEGWHECYGEAHAEVNAVQAVEDKSLLREATIYVSLEPCHHFGKTPPCVDLILKHRFKRVVIATTDPYPEVAGKSIKKLEEAGVEVSVGILEAEARHLARRFFTKITKKRPYIILKWACSQDGFLGEEGKQIWLTSPSAKRLSHKWRAEEDAILVGKHTMITDKPQLNNRLYLGKSPQRFYIASEVLDETNDFIFISSKNKTAQETLFALIARCNELAIKSIIIEGGAYTLRQFLAYDLWDEARIFRSPKILEKGIKSPTISGTYSHLCQKKISGDLLDIYLKE